MNDDVTVATFVVLDELMRHAGHKDHALAGVSDAEVLTVAVVAAAYFQNHHARALQVIQGMHDLSGHLSTSRFNRRLHALADWVGYALTTLGEFFATGEAFILDSLPLPVCRRVRARRCRKVRGKEYCGYCAAKRETFFGWRLHLVVTPVGVPVAFVLLPAACHDLTPVHELTVGLPADSCAYGTNLAIASEQLVGNGDGRSASLRTTHNRRVSSPLRLAPPVVALSDIRDDDRRVRSWLCPATDAPHPLLGDFGEVCYGNKAFNSKADEASILADTGVRLVPIRQANMQPHLWADKLALREHRGRIETTNSQLEAMGIQQLHARTNPGFELKVHASLLALTIINAR